MPRIWNTSDQDMHFWTWDKESEKLETSLVPSTLLMVKTERLKIVINIIVPSKLMILLLFNKRYNYSDSLFCLTI